ncbi:MAG: hypothetical protein AAFY21_21175 [Cyanobacteria bacterium J06641_2]
MFNYKLFKFKNLAKVALTLSIIGLSFGCEKSSKQNNPDTTTNLTKKVEFQVNVTDGVRKGETLNGSYTYIPETFELVELNLKGFKNQDISQNCKNLTVNKDSLGLNGTCNADKTIYTFGDDAPGRGHIVHPFGYAVEAQNGSDGVGVVEYNNAT